jgi:hypothetical protein
MIWSFTGARRAGAPLLAAALAASVLAVAAPSPASAAGALNIKADGTCSLLNGAGAVVGKTHLVVTKKGNALWKCRGTVSKPASGHAVTYSGKKTGLICSTPAGDTTRWHQTISASGRAVLTCHVHSAKKKHGNNGHHH